jgi:hypothetical protein
VRRPKLTTAVLIAAFVAAAVFFAMTVRNDYCLPWQERVGYGDGPFGPEEEVSVCR